MSTVRRRRRFVIVTGVAIASAAIAVGLVVRIALILAPEPRGVETPAAGSTATATPLEATDGPLEPAPSPARRTELSGEGLGSARALRVLGRVVAPDGAPAAGAAVWSTLPDAPASEVAAWTLSRDDGAFELALVRSEFTLHASGTNLGETSRVVSDTEANELLRIDDLVLPRGGTIHGRVLDVQGAGIEGLEVQAWAKRGAVWSTTVAGHRLDVGYREDVTDAEGRFVLAGLRGVPHDVLPMIEGWDSRWDRERADGVLPDGEELVFRQLPDGTLRGRVVDAATNAPIRSFDVNGMRHDDPDGRFLAPFTNVSGIFVGADGYYGDTWQPATDRDSKADCVHSFALEALPPRPDGCLVVRAVDERGEAVDGIRVRSVWGNALQRTVHEYFEERDIVRAPGETRIHGLWGAPRELFIDAPRHACTLMSLRFEAGRENRVEVMLEPGASARIQVRDDYGLVARNCRFEIDSARRKERHVIWKGTDSGFGAPVIRTDSGERIVVGTARGALEGLPAGRYTLIVHVDDERSESFEFEVDAEEERIHDFRIGARR